MKKKREKPLYVKHVTPLASLWSFVLWLVGILVFLAVGFGMIGETLIVPWIPVLITITAGWFVVVLTILGFVLKVIDMSAW